MTELQWGRRRLVEVGGVDINVETAGDPHAPPIVALHGFTSGTFTWAGLAPLLADRARFVAWDRPPFGRSGRPRPGPGPTDPYGLDAELARTASLAERFTDGPVVLLGHSAGALLATQVVLADLVQVAAVVLIAPALDQGPPPIVGRLASVPGSSFMGPAALKVALLAAAPAIRAAGRHATPLMHATSAEAGRHLRRPGTAEALWHLSATWRSPSVMDRLAEIDVPMTVVGGDEDRIVPADAHERVAAALGAELHLLAGVGHAAHEQVPEQVAGILRGVLDTLERRDGEESRDRW